MESPSGRIYYWNKPLSSSWPVMFTGVSCVLDLSKSLATPKHLVTVSGLPRRSAWAATDRIGLHWSPVGGQ